jgi:Na+/glutamate symporter
MSNDNNQLGYRERDKLFKKHFTELKIKVALNWFELIALLAVSFFASIKLLELIGLDSKLTTVLFAATIAIIITALFCYIRKYKLSINRFDKERIYKLISKELHQSTKTN